MMMMMVSECSLSEDRLEQAGSALRERGLLGTPTWEFQDVLERRDVFPLIQERAFFLLHWDAGTRFCAARERQEIRDDFFTLMVLYRFPVHV